jgi:hypothetical protein
VRGATIGRRPLIVKGLAAIAAPVMLAVIRGRV